METTNRRQKPEASGLPQSASHPETLASHRQAIERVVRMMNDRTFEDLKLDEMASVACMSPYYFNRLFRELVGIPPGQFLGALRLEAAKHLLLTTEESVLDICYEVGYNSLGTFTSRFNQLVGLPPGQFRQLSRAFAHNAEEVLSLVEPPPPPSTGPLLEGSIESEETLAGCIFMGTFDAAIPQARPLTCAILAETGLFRLAVPEVDRFYLFAAGMDRFEEPLDFLRTSDSVQGLASAGPFLLNTEGCVTERPHLRLRPPTLLDPPLLMSLPPLIDERLAEKLNLEDEPA